LKYKKIKISRSADQGHIGETGDYRWVERSNSDRHADEPWLSGSALGRLSSIALVCGTEVMALTS